MGGVRDAVSDILRDFDGSRNNACCRAIGEKSFAKDAQEFHFYGQRSCRVCFKRRRYGNRSRIWVTSTAGVDVASVENVWIAG